MIPNNGIFLPMIFIMSPDYTAPHSGDGASLLKKAFFDKQLRSKESVLQDGVTVVLPE
jgi:hypothetical protein